jgi:hypothetical protein
MSHRGGNVVEMELDSRTLGRFRVPAIALRGKDAQGIAPAGKDGGPHFTLLERNSIDTPDY